MDKAELEHEINGLLDDAEAAIRVEITDLAKRYSLSTSEDLYYVVDEMEAVLTKLRGFATHLERVEGLLEDLLEESEVAQDV